MGKQGPCYHCGISSEFPFFYLLHATPLWRNGPPEKPVLCNACGSRWRTKGTLANYMPMHSGGCGANESLDYKWPRGKKVLQKSKEQRSHKKKDPCDVHCQIEFGVTKSNPLYGKVLDEDASTRSSSVSGISYSEGCMHHGGATENYSTVAVQSSVWDSPVPSKKRTCMFRQRPSSLDKLTKSMQHISQEQESSSLSSSSEENVLFECKASLDGAEIGLGSVFMRKQHSVLREEESEASSLLIDNKGYSTFDFLTDNIVLPERWKEISDLSPGKSANSTMHDEVLKRFLQGFHLQLKFIELEDVINFDTFMGQLSEEEQRHLMKYLSTVDDPSLPGSLECMFKSAQFQAALSNFQHLLSEGMFGTHGSRINPKVQHLFQQLLKVTDMTNSKWMERYSQLQKYKPRGCAKASKILQSKEATKQKNFCLFESSISESDKPATYKAFTNSSGQPPGQVVAGSEMCTKTFKSWLKNIPKAARPFTPPGKMFSTEGMHHDSIDTGSTSKEAAGYETGLKSSSCFSPNNPFSSPLDKSSPFGLESIEAFADEVSDSVLLFNVPSNMSFPQAELLQSPLKCKPPKDIVATDSKFENEKSGGPTTNNTWISQESIEWDSLFWNAPFVGSSETMPGGPVLFPGKTHQ